MTSVAWNYFTKIDDNKAKCNINNCGAVIQFSKGTSGLLNHITKIHKIQCDTKKRSGGPATGDVLPEKRQKTIADFLNKRSIEREVASLVAKSKFTFNQIATTPLIRDALSQRYPNATIPKEIKQVAEMLEKFYYHAENEVKEK